MAAKLLAVKVGVLRKKSAASAIPAKVYSSALGPGSSLPGVKSFSKFDSQQISTDPKFSAFKELNPFSIV